MQNLNCARAVTGSIMGMMEAKKPCAMAQGFFSPKILLDGRSQRSGLCLQIAQHPQVLPQRLVL
ncbi:MAG TPA: hypothetical protein VGN44_06690, partial [Candidatus Angelobacter sp.]